MGIERFFNSLSKNINIKTKNGIVLGFETKLDCNYLYIDFNSIIYTIVSKIEEELNYLLYSIIIKDFDNTHAQESAKIWKYSLEREYSNIESFKEYFTANIIDKVAIQRIKEYIYFILNNFINIKTIKHI
jgi:hypothetical protein